MALLVLQLSLVALSIFEILLIDRTFNNISMMFFWFSINMAWFLSLFLLEGEN